MKLALGLSKRAESYDPSHLSASFVEIGNVPTLLKNNDSAIIFGRRGTGKTHLLSYLASELQRSGTTAVSIDMRTIGSSSGLYSDPGIDLSERSTRLLRDTANAIHEKILEAYGSQNDHTFGSSIIEALDSLTDAANSIKIIGAVTREQSSQHSGESASNFGFALNASIKPSASLTVSDGLKTQVNDSAKEVATGTATIQINFGQLTSALKAVVRNLPGKRLWILLDEWSEVPLDLQPYLADMLRRGFLAVGGVTAKIAAIEHRSQLRVVSEQSGQSVGIQIGADVAMSINLDDHMVFDNDSSAASTFFAQMLFQHIRSLAEAENKRIREENKKLKPGEKKLEEIEFDVTSPEDLTRLMFTQKDCFGEFVRASEGVPRDGINILSKCALKASADKISMQTVRSAARAWYMTSKQNDIASRPRANALMEWIMSEVIGTRKARGFLLDIRAKDDLIDFLFDSRVLHIIKRGISSKDSDDTGKKFNAWALDYGCYVDLLSTASAPKGLYEVEEEEAMSDTKYVDVPQTDYRSLRRAVLDLSAFYAAEAKAAGSGAVV